MSSAVPESGGGSFGEPLRRGIHLVDSLQGALTEERCEGAAALGHLAYPSPSFWKSLHDPAIRLQDTAASVLTHGKYLLKVT